jgi:hypothetical protein
MDSETWNYFVLLRPLIVLLPAALLLLVAALSGWIKRRADEKRRPTGMPSSRRGCDSQGLI